MFYGVYIIIGAIVEAARRALGGTNAVMHLIGICMRRIGLCEIVTLESVSWAIDVRPAIFFFSFFARAAK